MKKPIIKVTVITEEEGYSATTSYKDDFIATEGETIDELKKNMLEAVNLSFMDSGFTFSDDDLKFEFDLPSFFKYYNINVKDLSERVGINRSLLSQYINGIKKPSPSRVECILKGVQDYGKELVEASIIIERSVHSKIKEVPANGRPRLLVPLIPKRLIIDKKKKS
jgi:transcriptional regulator with XRE-family HTH domain